ncbi:MAG: hypothetical protein JWN86_3420 [Planctomycetota bacterium]|nr:hypothetical protein [Planctomycetota bacterium]
MPDARKSALLVLAMGLIGSAVPLVHAGDALPKARSGPAPAVPVARAGGDRTGVVGRRLNLDGGRSLPEGRVGYRWLQISGPTPSENVSEGSSLSFVPTTSGTYRFALLVGLESRVSEPDFVTVEVSNDPKIPPAGPTPLAQWFSGAVSPIPRGAETAGQVADVFEAIAQRVPLYTSYSQLQTELTRRLDVVVPSDPTIRNAWAQRVFLPLSQVTAAELLATGIDTRVPSPAERSLDETQKARLQTVYRGLADACRPRSGKP